MDEDVEKFEEENIEDDSPLKKFLKKTYIILMALFLVMLILGNSFAGSHLVFLFSGKIASTTLTNNTLSFQNKTIYFEPAIIEALNQLYNDNPKTEIKLCLTGKRQGDSYFVTGMYTPVIFKKDVFSVTSQICNTRTVLDLHTHPYLHCIFSNQDMKSYQEYRKYNPDAIMALMCDIDRFSLYGY